MAFLDDLSSLLGGAPVSGNPAAASPSGMTNYGAAPTPQGVAAAPMANVLARLRGGQQPPNPLGVSTPAVGGNMAASLGGLAQVNPHSSRFGAFAQGLAGGINAQQQAQAESAKLGIAQQSAGLDNALKAAQIQGLQTQIASRQNAASRLRSLLPGGSADPSASTAAPSAPTPQTTAQPASSPVAAPPVGDQSAPAPAATDASASPAPTAPVRMIPHGLARSPDFWSNVAPSSNPALMDKTADAYEAAAIDAAADPQTAKRLSDTANQYRQRAQQIRTNGMVTLNDGSQALIPGFAHSKAMVAAITTAAEEGVKDQHQVEKIQPTLGGPTMYTTRGAVLAGQAGGGGLSPGAAPPAMPPTANAPGAPGAQAAPAPQQPGGVIAQQPAFVAEQQKKIADDENAAANQFQKRQVARDRLQTMAGIMQDYQPGAFAEHKADIVAKLRGVGVNVPDSATANPAAFQEFVKYASANVLSDVAETSGGSQPLVSEMEAIKKANANPELQPAAVAALLSHSMGVIDYKDAHYRAYNDWKKANPYATSTADFETGWAKDNPVSKYTEPVVKGMAYQGQDIPAVGKRTVGQTYMTPKGPLVWQSGGWARPSAPAQ